MSSPRNTFPVPAGPRQGTGLAPVGFAHRTAPAVFLGRGNTPARNESGDGLRFEGRVTRPGRFPVEAALAMNDPRALRLGHHVDMHC